MELIVAPRASASESMAFDEGLFNKAEKGILCPTLRIYSWLRPSITVGYSQSLDDEIDLELCGEYGIDVAKRPTGGGIDFHSPSDIAFGILLDAEDSRILLQKTSNAVRKALKFLGVEPAVADSNSDRDRRFCCSYPSRFELEVGGRKIAGIAQRRGRRSVLQQVSIAVSGNVDNMLKCLKNGISAERYTLKTTCLTEQIGRAPDISEFSEALAGEMEAGVPISY